MKNTKVMAIKREKENTFGQSDNYRRLLQPFVQDESGVKALQGFFDADNKITREGMYLLEILNNVISKENGTEKVFQRIPSEVFRGLPEGGRRNVQASLIARTVQGSDKEESRRIHPSGYTRVQELIGQWAERDGSWSDTPEKNLTDKGFLHDPTDDGSEARIFDSEDGEIVVKTIDFSHYSDFELMLDRITIHNAVFPEMAMKVEGFGMRDDTPDIPEEFHRGFVVTISQKKAEGVVPTQEQIKEGLNERFFNKTNNGFFWLNGFDNIVLADIHDQNAVRSPGGLLLVFDCEAFLKTFPVDPEKPEIVPIDKLLPDKNGKFNQEAWKKILGEDFAMATTQELSSVVKELRTTGKITGLVNGKSLLMENPESKYLTSSDGQKRRYFDGNVLVGTPKAFEKEHLWKVPELQYDDRLVEEITKVTHHLMPYEVDLEDFLYNPKWVGQSTANYHEGGDYRKFYREELKTNGRIDGLVNNQYVVQRHPTDKSKVLISTPSRLGFMLWTGQGSKPDLPGAQDISQEDLQNLAAGKTVYRNGQQFYFDLDKGRIDNKQKGWLKLSQKIDTKEKHGINKNKVQKPQKLSI